MTGLRMVLVGGLVCAQAAVGVAQSTALAPASTAGMLEVTYEFTSAGRKGPSADGVLVSKDWNVKRTVVMSVRLTADKPSGFPQLAKLTGSRAQRETERQAATMKAGADLAPMMAQAEAIMEKCGEDEACLAAAAMAMGAAMNPNEMAAAKKSVDRAVDMPDATFQAWRGSGSSMRFTVSESMTVRDKDPLCMELAGGTCTTSTSGSGSGPLAPAGGKDPFASGMAVAEVDGEAHTITVMLPMPAALVPVALTTKTDRPRESSGPSTTERAVAKTLDPVTVSCPGGCRTQSGTTSVSMTDELSGEAGTLTVRWSFKAQ